MRICDGAPCSSDQGTDWFGFVRSLSTQKNESDLGCRPQTHLMFHVFTFTCTGTKKERMSTVKGEEGKNNTC